MLSKLLGIKQGKMEKVMGEYKRGTLKSSSGFSLAYFSSAGIAVMTRPAPPVIMNVLFRICIFQEHELN